MYLFTEIGWIKMTPHPLLKNKWQLHFQSLSRVRPRKNSWYILYSDSILEFSVKLENNLNCLQKYLCTWKLPLTSLGGNHDCGCHWWRRGNDDSWVDALGSQLVVIVQATMVEAVAPPTEHHLRVHLQLQKITLSSKHLAGYVISTCSVYHSIGQCCSCCLLTCYK